jgi:hypothetical protein
MVDDRFADCAREISIGKSNPAALAPITFIARRRFIIISNAR